MKNGNASPWQRAFVAVELPDEVRGALREVHERLRAVIGSASWVRPENYHITLRFLGSVPERDIESFASAVGPQFARIVPFVVRVQGVGAFPNARRASVLWAGAAAPGVELASIFRIAELGAIDIGLAAETRPFAGHMTLARFKERGGRDVSRAIDFVADFDAGDFTARSVALFASSLSPSGAMYTRLREFPFHVRLDTSTHL